ncbi:hypothetical protein RHGRI_030154 [Rhododendron griersonianum]|uniref:Uncharacterized protein n=1 Tax=Rhododendron griersonianum TaxID=479676 RepID=A0AAV6IN07_9ERIC|nr:hypothetical protein RHGRI_030154 [Rhododendron griersonianum]
MHIQVLGDVAQEAVHVLLLEMLLKMPLRSTWDFWQQANMPLLQQLEDPTRRSQMSLNLIKTTLYYS